MSRGLFDILSQYDLTRWKPDKGGPHEPLGTAFIFFRFKMTSYNSAQNGFTPVTRFGLSSIWVPPSLVRKMTVNTLNLTLEQWSFCWWKKISLSKIWWSGIVFFFLLLGKGKCDWSVWNTSLRNGLYTALESHLSFTGNEGAARKKRGEA